jgi:2-polyprenyl-3-methyl-5-hydroxy-6-metoxy-1,4-benzoquinol methylase
MRFCKICNSSTSYLFTQKVLKKYNVDYFKCDSCNFISTDEPFWLTESYQDAIADADTGILERNIKFKKVVPFIIKIYFNPKGKFLDYGAGYGIFVRMMRDNGYDFWWQDEYCNNLFARKFDIKTLSNDTKFELLTAFEVFEHLKDPKSEVKKMLQFSDNILFSTILTDSVSEIKDWWYLSPETGQHISLFSKQSLQKLALELRLNFYSNGYNFHLLSSKKINPFLFNLLGIFYKLKHKLKQSKEYAKLDRDAYIKQ